MSVEQELRHLLEELADDHVVGDPPAFEVRSATWSERNRERDRFRSVGFMIGAVAACSVVLIGGLVAISSLGDDQPPAAAPSTTSETSGASAPESTAPPPPPAPAPDVAASPSLDLIRIDARATSEGTTDVVLVFDGDLPKDDVTPIENLESPPTDHVGYATQISLDSPVSVCGGTHWFPEPGNRIVDVFVPSDWFDPAASFDPPTTWEPDGAAPAKIIVCEPRNGTVQISVWGSASGRMEDTRVSVGERTITIDIAPDPADRSTETTQGEPLPTSPPIDPLDRPLVAITGDGDAVYFTDDETTPVLIFDGPDPDDASPLGDGPNAVDRVAYGAAENRFIVSRCCSPAVGQIVTVTPDDLPMPVDISPPTDQVGAPLVFDGFGYAPAMNPDGDRQVSIVGGGRGISVIDATDNTFTELELPLEAGDLWDLVWNDSGIIILGRTESTWTLSTANYSPGRIELDATRNFAPLSNFEDLRFAGTAVDGEIAVHDLRTDMVLSGTVDDYGNNNGDERGSSLQVITLPSAALSAWFHDPGQLIWVDTDRVLRVGDRIVPGEHTWARR